MTYPDPKRFDGPSDTESALSLLDPIRFSRSFPELLKRIYPGGIKLLGGTPIIAKEYILVDDEPTLQFMQLKGDFRLEVVVEGLRDPIVTVKKYRFCGGKALVLLTSKEDLDPLYTLPLRGRIRAVSTTDPDRRGTIKPGGKGHGGVGQDGNTNTIGRGQDGNTNTIGRGQGYPNCIGYNHPGVTLEGEGLASNVNLGPADSPVRVAVLDSGVRYRQDPPTRRVKTTCFTIELGYDFVDEDRHPNDEQHNQHGTRVASIIRKVCPQARIIPVRIADANNACTLYDVLCGLEYAAQQRVQVINASWVFPTFQGNYIPLLQASLRRLAYQGILVVCSAGNVGFVPPEGLEELPHIGESKNGTFVPMLSPACSSESLENVITVTSVAEVPDAPGSAHRKHVVCELRSKRFISVGVITNGPDTPAQFGCFETPNFNPFRGTSFAAPYVTGHIAQLFLRGRRVDRSSRKAILQAIGAVRDPNLKKFIRRGMCMKAD